MIRVLCLQQVAQEPQFIFWYHNDRMINYDRQQLQFQPGKSRARVQVLTESMLAANKGKGLVDHANSNSNNGVSSLLYYALDYAMPSPPPSPPSPPPPCSQSI